MSIIVTDMILGDSENPFSALNGLHFSSLAQPQWYAHPVITIRSSMAVGVYVFWVFWIGDDEEVFFSTVSKATGSSGAVLIELAAVELESLANAGTYYANGSFPIVDTDNYGPWHRLTITVTGDNVLTAFQLRLQGIWEFRT